MAYHHRVNVPLVLANLSLRLGRGVRLDPATVRATYLENLARHLKAIRDGRAEDVVLQPEDIVTVPRRFF